LRRIPYSVCAAFTDRRDVDVFVEHFHNSGVGSILPEVEYDRLIMSEVSIALGASPAS